MSIEGASPLSGGPIFGGDRVAKFTKDVLYPGTYRLPDGRKVTYTPADVRHLSKRLADMTAAGLQIPLCWDHQHEAKPVQMGADRSDRHKWNLGFAEAARLTPEGYLETGLDVPLDEDAKRLPAVRYVSPEITTDYVDGSGRKWPGLSITHVAVTSRPVQFKQNPFKPVQLGYPPDAVWLSLGDMAMAESDKAGDKSGDKGGSGGPDIKKILTLLASKGVPLPDDTTSDNFMDRLHVALVATGATEDGGSDTEIETESDDTNVAPPPPVTMSMDQLQGRNKTLEARLVASERAGLQGRVKALFGSGKISKQIRDKLLGELNTVQLSLDGNGNLRGSKILAKIEAYEDLAGIVNQRSAQLSMDGGRRITEVPPPADVAGRPQTPQEVDAALNEWDAALGRK